MQESVRQLINENIQNVITTGEALSAAIENSAIMVVNTLLNGGKIICCGDGATSGLACHFAQLLLDQYETERPCLPAFALQPATSGFHPAGEQHLHLARQVKALGQASDVLVVIALSGSEPALIKAVEAALTNDMKIIALTMNNNSELSGLLSQQDIELNVPIHRQARRYECYVFLLHCICELTDMTLFPQQEEI